MSQTIEGAVFVGGGEERVEMKCPVPLGYWGLAMIACWACFAMPVRHVSSARVDVVTEPKLIYKHDSTPLRSLFHQMVGNWGSL